MAATTCGNRYVCDTQCSTRMLRYRHYSPQSDAFDYITLFPKKETLKMRSQQILSLFLLVAPLPLPPPTHSDHDFFFPSLPTTRHQPTTTTAVVAAAAAAATEAAKGEKKFVFKRQGKRGEKGDLELDFLAPYTASAAWL